MSEPNPFNDLPLSLYSKDTNTNSYHRELWVLSPKSICPELMCFKDIYRALNHNQLNAKHLYVGSPLSEISKSYTNFFQSSDSKNQYSLNNIQLEAKQYKSQLGHEYQSMVFNALDGFNPNAFVALCSTITHGGIIFLIAPSLEKWPLFNDPDYKRIEYYGQKLNNINGEKLFIGRIVHFLRTFQQDNPNEFRLIGNVDMLQNAINSFKDKQNTIVADEIFSNKIQFYSEQLTQQDIIIANIEEKLLATNELANSAIESALSQKHVFFIHGRRGRGKSSTLARLMAKMPTVHFVLTAQTKHSINTINEQFAKHNGKNEWTFYAPDNLIKQIQSQTIDTDKCSLIIEEAATIPLSMLAILIENFNSVILLTTIDGYEGSAHGLALKLDDLLKKSPINVNRHDYYLTKPMRWFEGDVIEKWLNSTFLMPDKFIKLSASSSSKPADKLIKNDISEKTIQFGKVEFQKLLNWQKKETQADSILTQIYQLLETAHYKTTPEDLRLLLDSPQIEVFYGFINFNDKTKVVAAALIAIEGNQSLMQLSEQINSGERRPRGHFTPVYLAKSCQFKAATSYRYARFIRIATSLDFRRNGIASQLFSFIENYQNINDIDFLSTSFSLANENIHFWRKQGMILLNIGTKKEKSSGAASALFLKMIQNKPTDESIIIFLNEQKQSFSNLLPKILSTFDQQADADLIKSIRKCVKLNSDTKN